MRNSKNTPEIHAGSTADIAFLLLIFFLVTTRIPNDKGIPRKLHRACDTPECIAKAAKRNTLTIQLNESGVLYANNEIQSIEALEVTIRNFIDNNGDGSCSYCSGTKALHLSENPQKALINIEAHPNSNYKHYINIQNSISRVLIALRNSYAVSTWNKSFKNLNEKEKKEVLEAYPLLLVEGTIQMVN